MSFEKKTPLGGENQTLQSHIRELRKRLVLALSAFFLSFLVLYPFSTDLFNFLVQPLASLLQDQDSRRLIYTGLAEAFMVHIKVSLFGAVALSLPWMLYQIWLFIAPGLYVKERKTFWFFLIGGPCLFIVGVAFAYFIIMPLAWSFFLSFETPLIPGGLPIQLEARVGEYLSLSLQLMLAFGVSFQLPVLLLLLGKLGVVTGTGLAKGRRYAFLCILVVAAFLTPPDVLSQIGLAIPLYGLYELSIALVRRQKIEKQKDDRS
ncbi:MAG: twin-arginine translocase subunit TatC [bacterium]|nr:twin-arginine translocase subunit TatC [bacterium]